MKFQKIFIIIIFINSCATYAQNREIKKYENGNIKFEGYSIGNVLDSIYREYYENGNIKTEGFYKDCEYETNKRKIHVVGCGIATKTDSLILGKRHGKLKTFYKNGKVKSISNFHCGLKQGNFYDYYENGNLETQEFYFENRLKSYQSYKENGNIEETENFEYNYKKTRDYKTTNHKEFYENGDLKIENIIVEEENDIEIENYKEYFQNGFLKIEKILINNSKMVYTENILKMEMLNMKGPSKMENQLENNIFIKKTEELRK